MRNFNLKYYYRYFILAKYKESYRCEFIIIRINKILS